MRMKVCVFLLSQTITIWMHLILVSQSSSLSSSSSIVGVPWLVNLNVGQLSTMIGKANYNSSLFFLSVVFMLIVCMLILFSFKWMVDFHRLSFSFSQLLTFFPFIYDLVRWLICTFPFLPSFPFTNDYFFGSVDPMPIVSSQIMQTQTKYL